MAERQPENVLSQIKQQGEIVRTLKNEGAEKNKVSIGAFWYIHEFSRGVTVRKAGGWHRDWESVTVCISHKKSQPRTCDLYRDCQCDSDSVSVSVCRRQCHAH